MKNLIIAISVLLSVGCNLPTSPVRYVTMQVRVLDAYLDEPIAGATVHVNTLILHTDGNGRTEYTLPAGTTINLLIEAKGYVSFRQIGVLTEDGVCVHRLHLIGD